MAQVPVDRENGADGVVTLKWRTEDMSAVEGKEYFGKEGTIVFDSGELNKTIDIHLVDAGVRSSKSQFPIDFLESMFLYVGWAALLETYIYSF